MWGIIILASWKDHFIRVWENMAQHPSYYMYIWCWLVHLITTLQQNNPNSVFNFFLSCVCVWMWMCMWVWMSVSVCFYSCKKFMMNMWFSWLLLKINDGWCIFGFYYFYKYTILDKKILMLFFFVGKSQQPGEAKLPQIWPVSGTWWGSR